jgi:hypothetical protein
LRAVPALSNAEAAMAVTVPGMTSLCLEAGNFRSVAASLSYRTPAIEEYSAFPDETSIDLSMGASRAPSPIEATALPMDIVPSVPHPAKAPSAIATGT